MKKLVDLHGTKKIINIKHSHPAVLLEGRQMRITEF